MGKRRQISKKNPRYLWAMRTILDCHKSNRSSEDTAQTLNDAGLRFSDGISPITAQYVRGKLYQWYSRSESPLETIRGFFVDSKEPAPAAEPLPAVKAIHKSVHVVRGAYVMADADVAGAFGMETGALNENAARSPKWQVYRDAGLEGTLRFQLTEEETITLFPERSQIAMAHKNANLPWMYTKDGCVHFSTSMTDPTRCRAAIRLRGLCEKAEEAKLAVVEGLLARIRKAETKIAEYTRELEAAKKMHTELRVVLPQVADQEERITVLEAKLNTDENYFTVMAFHKMQGWDAPNEVLSSLGKAAKKLSQERGILTGVVSHSKYDKVGIYHRTILQEVCSLFYKKPVLQEACSTRSL